MSLITLLSPVSDGELEEELRRRKQVREPEGRHRMNEYLVTWEINIWADSPVEAAKQALAIQRDRMSIATVFKVGSELIDLEEEVEW